jgi:hypothetical protein
MSTREHRTAFWLWGAASVLVGVGFNTPPGEPALLIPRRADWSATEAKVIGACACVLGVYVAVFLDRKRANKRAA